MTQSVPADYGAAFTAQVGKLVKEARKRAGISAQRLADACTEQGVPLTRSIIASLELGRRNAISVAELFAIAHVLEIPPVTLLFPITTAPFDDCVTRPNTDQHATYGLAWVTGQLKGQPSGTSGEPSKLELAAFQQWRLVKDLNRFRDEATNASRSVLNLRMIAEGDPVGSSAEDASKRELVSFAAFGLMDLYEAWGDLVSAGVKMPALSDYFPAITEVPELATRIATTSTDDSTAWTAKRLRVDAEANLKRSDSQ